MKEDSSFVGNMKNYNKHSISQDSIDKANELVNAIDLLGKNLGADIKYILTNNGVDYTAEDIVMLSKQALNIQNFIMKKVTSGKLSSLKLGLDMYT